MRWEHSLLLPFALSLVIATFVVAEPRQDMLRVQVLSAVSGDTMPGAIVEVGDDAYLADDAGEVMVARPDMGVEIRARADGFTEVDRPSPLTNAGNVRVIQMQPSLVNGVVRDAETGEPIPGAEIVLTVGGGTEVATSRSDSHGAYIFKNVPGDAIIHVHVAGYDAAWLPIGSRLQLDIELVPSSMHRAGGRIVRQGMTLAIEPAGHGANDE